MASNEKIDKIVGDAKQRLAKTEAQGLKLVQKGFAELAESIPKPSDELIQWQAENTIRRQVGSFAEYVLQPVIENHVEAAIIEGYQTADELLRQALTGTPLENALIENAQGLSQQLRDDALRKPLADLVNAMPEEAVKFFRQAAVLGTQVDFDKLYLNFARLDRTLTFNTYRAAKQATYRANNHVVQSWVWHSACDRRTCVVCWANHGSVHDLSEDMVSHSNCRCTCIPKTKTWKELGFNVPDELESSINVPLGEDLFESLDVGDKMVILGPSAYAEYEKGNVTLRDFVGYSRGSDDKVYPRRKSNRDLGIERTRGKSES